LHLANHPSVLSEMSASAIVRAKQFSLTAYRDRLLDAIP
jgi:hypothetical protein